MQQEEGRKMAWQALYEGRRRAVKIVHFGVPGRPLPYDGNRRARIEWALAQYRLEMDTFGMVADDRVPHVHPYTGTEIFARAFGAAVHESGDNMPFALPVVRRAADVARLRPPTLEAPALADVIGIADELRAAEPGALMRLPDIQSPMDIAALIWDKNDFYAAMIEEPEAVDDLIGMTAALLTQFLDFWFDRYGRAFVAHYPDYYMPRGVTLSEDEAGVVSAPMLERFAMPHLRALSARFGGIGIHCCANARHQWPLLAGVPGLRMMNLVQPSAVLDEALVRFAPVCVQMHAENPRPGKARLAGPFAGRVVLHAAAGSVEEARRKLDELSALEEALFAR